MDELVKSRFIEMFGDPITNPKGWNTAKLGEICSTSKEVVHQDQLMNSILVI